MDRVIIRIMTHESIVHSQITSLERLLNREIDFALTLNIRGVKSSIEFSATEDEIHRVKADLGYRIFMSENNNWVKID
jgi:hypothetical protein